MQEKYINPLTDFGFKKIFGEEPNKELLIHFLNQILPDKKIENLSYSAVEKLGFSEMDRKAVFDLYCIGENGERFIVEMQKARQNYFKDRSVFYASFPIQEMSKKNNWNFELDAVYSIGILDFIFDDHKHQTDELYHLVELKNQRCEVFYNKLKFVYIELPKFTKQADQLDTQLDKWLYTLKHLSQLQNRPTQLQERIFTRLFEVAEIAKFSPLEQEGYQRSLKYYRDLKNVVDTSKQEGFEEGREAGFEQGKEEGFEQGKEATQTDFVVVAYKEGLSIEMIEKLTQLPQNIIREILKNNGFEM